MQFLLLVYKDPVRFAAVPDAEKRHASEQCDTWGAELDKTGHLRGMNRLHAPTSAATVRKSSVASSLVTDGPFAETKEVLAGYVLIECRDRTEAVAIAQTFPGLVSGIGVEVRAVLSGEEERQCWHET
jgi:hypothetical protein